MPKHNEIFWYPGYELPLIDIVRAENCYLYDSKGKRYLDLEAGVWCCSVGQNNPATLRAIADQAERIMHNGFNYVSPIVFEAGRKLLRLHNMENGRFVFLCSGSEAVEYGVRLVQMISEKPLLMTMTDSYFGAYGSAQRRSNEKWYSFDWKACEGCPEDKTCDSDCESWKAVPFDRIGGFLFEPGSSSGFVRFPQKKLMKRICERIHDSGGFFMVNEVTTGIGRTGQWFGYQHYDVTPDIVAMGKGLGNGYPVSATVFSKHILDWFGDREMKYAQSHQNDPLGAAVVIAVIKYIEENNLIEQGRELGKVLVEGLLEIKRKTGKIETIRNRGFLTAVDLIESPGQEFARTVHRQLIDNGFLVCLRPGSRTFRIDPSLTIEGADISEFLAVLSKILRLTKAPI